MKFTNAFTPVFFDEKMVKPINGLVELTLPNLEMFLKLIRDNEYFRGYIFRGQPSGEYLLKPSLFRNSGLLNQTDIESHLGKFKMYSRGRIEHEDLAILSEDDFWSIGQHFGLKTPLLDWSTSPFVAMYFAFEHVEESALNAILKSEIQSCIGPPPEANKNQYAAVYFLNAHSINQKYYGELAKELCVIHEEFQGLLKEERPDLDKIIEATQRIVKANRANRLVEDIIRKCESNLLKVISPLGSKSNRLLAQRGLFTKLTLAPSIEESLPRICLHKDSVALIKVYLHKTIGEGAKKDLDSMNINKLTIYPDLIGASEYANDKLK